MPWEGDKWVGPLPTIEEIRAMHDPDTDEPIWCDCCFSEDVPLKVYKANDEIRGYELLCDLCIGAVVDDKRSDPAFGRKTLAILETICFVGNEILKELRRSRGG